MASMSLESAVRLFLAWVDANRSKSTAGVYRLYLDLFVDQVGQLELEACRPIHLLAGRQSFHALQAVKRFFAWCVSPAELIKKSPMAAVPLPRLGCRKRILAEDQSARLLRRSCAAFRRFLLAMRETAARPQEVRGFEWVDVRGLGGAAFALEDLPAGRCLFMLTNWKTKGRTQDMREHREIPISPRLGRLLVRLWRAAPGRRGPILQDTRAKPWTANSVRCQMRRLRVRAGLGDQLGGERICNYTFRHTAATALVLHGAPLPVVQEILGHTQLATTARYLHPGRGEMLLAIRLGAETKKRARDSRRAR